MVARAAGCLSWLFVLQNLNRCSGLESRHASEQPVYPAVHVKVEVEMTLSRSDVMA